MLTGKGRAINSLIDAICNKLKLTQAGVVIDRLEILTSLIGAEDTLKLIKTIKTRQEPCGLFPFFAHVDFSMMASQPLFDPRL